MFIPKEILQNFIMKFSVFNSIAKKHHSTGINSDREKAQSIYNYYAKFVDIKGNSILELGPGHTIEVLEIAKNNGANYCAAIDITSYLSMDHVNKLGIDFKIYDGKNIPFENEMFNTVWSSSVFEHVRYPQIMVQECYRVLKPGGVMLCQIDLRDHYYINNDERIFECLKYSSRLWNLMTSNRSSYVNRLRYSEWIKLFKINGFIIDKVDSTKNKYIESNYKSIHYLKNIEKDDACIENMAVILLKP